MPENFSSKQIDDSMLFSKLDTIPDAVYAQTRQIFNPIPNSKSCQSHPRAVMPASVMNALSQAITPV